MHHLLECGAARSAACVCAWVFVVGWRADVDGSGRVTRQTYGLLHRVAPRFRALHEIIELCFSLFDLRE